MRAHLPPLPGLWAHLVLLWRLRLQLARRGREGRAGLLPAAASFLMAIGPAFPLFFVGYQLFTWAPVASSPIWRSLFFDLLAFVITCVWIAWPILSAGVDDESELVRYRHLPITPARLLIASTGASLFEPLAVILYAPVLGAMSGFLMGHPPKSWALVVALFLGWVALTATWSRAGLYAVLSVLRDKRGAQAVGGFFFFVIGASLLLPPVDVSWLSAVGGDFGSMTPAFALRAALGLSRVPTGFLGEGLRGLAEGRLLGAGLELAGLWYFAALGLFVAWRLQGRVTGDAARGAGLSGRARRLDPFAHGAGARRALVVREALDLWHNPRARLLFFVPFLLLATGRLFAARELVGYLAGPAVDAWLMGGFVVYGVVVFAMTFAQNAFGYDGRGMAMLLAAPVDLGEVVRAKHLVHGLAGATLAVLLALFYRFSFRSGGLWEVTLAISAGLALIPSLLTVGSLVSVFYPMPFHANLDRRDRQPRMAVTAGLMASGLGASPLVLALEVTGQARPGPLATVLVLAGAVVLWAVFFLTTSLRNGLLESRREKVLIGVSRG